MPTTRGLASSPWRAMKQHTLVVPTSSTATASPPLLILALRMLVPALPLGSFGSRLVVRLAHVDDRDVPGQKALIALELGQHRPGRLRRIRRQLHVHAIVESNVPAPIADPDRGAHAGREVEIGRAHV